MSEEKKKVLTETIENLKKLDFSSLQIMKSNAEVLKARDELEKAGNAEEKAG